MSDMTDSVIAGRRAEARAGADDGLLGWFPAIVVGYATILSPLLLQPAAPDLSSSAVASTEPSSNVANQLFWIGLLATMLFSCRHRLGRLVDALRQPIVLIVAIFIGLAFISVLWSPVPSVGFRRVALQFIVLATVVIPIFVVDDRQAQLDRLMRVLLAVATINLFPVLLLPAGRLGHEGIYSHKNELGLVATYAFVFCLYGVVRLRGLWRLFALACAGFAMLEVVLSQSKTSLGLALLIPTVAFLVVAISRGLRVNALFPLLFGIFFGALGYLFFAYLADFHFSDLSMLLFDDTTFTGRTIIWQFLGDVISRQPVLGQGYGSFWDIGEGSILKQEAPGFVVELLQGHNGYVDVTLELGVVGLVILLLFMGCALYNVCRHHSEEQDKGKSEAWLFLTVALIAVCHNMLESSWFRGYSVVWLIFVLVAAWAQPMSRRLQ